MADKQVKATGQANQITTKTLIVGGKEVKILVHSSSAKGR